MDVRTDRQTNGWMHDEHNTMTIARWPSASGAKNEYYCTTFTNSFFPFHPSLNYHLQILNHFILNSKGAPGEEKVNSTKKRNILISRGDNS